MKVAYDDDAPREKSACVRAIVRAPGEAKERELDERISRAREHDKVPKGPGRVKVRRRRHRCFRSVRIASGSGLLLELERAERACDSPRCVAGGGELPTTNHAADATPCGASLAPHTERGAHQRAAQLCAQLPAPDL